MIHGRVFYGIVMAMMLAVAWPVLAQESAPATPNAAAQATGSGGGDDLLAKVQNPVSSMYSLPLKFTADFGAPNGSAYFFNVNPVIPVTVGKWNFINRALIPAIVSVDGYIAGTPSIPEGKPANERKTGLGDINYSLFLSPADSKGAIWGLGPSVTFPTASEDPLGSKKWSGGPTGVVLFQPKWGTYGGLAGSPWEKFSISGGYFITAADTSLRLGADMLDLGVESNGEDYPQVDFKGKVDFRYTGLQLYCKIMF